MGKNLQTLGVSTEDVRAKDEEDIDEINKLEMHAEAMRKGLIANGKRD